MKWRDFFEIFSGIQERIELDDVRKSKNCWHPAAKGFAMLIDDGPQDFEEIIEVPPKPLVPDDYTDDDLEDDDYTDEKSAFTLGDDSSAVTKGDSINNEPEKIIKINKAKHWDVHQTNPIFFGFQTKTDAAHIVDKAEIKMQKKTRANRAAERAKKMRSDIIDGLERGMKNQADTRVKKMDSLEEKYEAATNKRKAEYDRNKDDMLDSAFSLFKVR